MSLFSFWRKSSKLDIYNRTLEEIKSVWLLLGSHYDSIDFLWPIGWGLIASFSKKNKCDLSHTRFQSNVASYMDFIGLLDSPNTKASNNYEHIIKLEPISIWMDCDAIAEKVYDISSKFLHHRKDELYNNLRYFVSEFTLNIPHHSQDKDTAFICGQYYKKAEVLQIAIVDSWIGIYESLRSTQSIEWHKDAIAKAITPWVTWNPWTSAYWIWHRNMWYGIPTCKKTIESNSWDFFLGSWNFMIAFNGKGVESNENYTAEYIELPFHWQWTFIVFNLYTDKEQNIDYAYIFDQLPDETESVKLDFI